MDNVRPLRPKKQPPKPARPRGSRRTRRRVIAAVIIAVVLLVLAFGSRILGLYIDWLWFGEVGFRGVFWTRFWAQLLVGLVAFAVFFVVVWINVEIARRLAPDFRADVDGTLLEPRSPRVRRWVGIGAVIVCAAIALVAGVSASSSWQKVLLFLDQVPWGQQDPQFHRDISFYVFSVPFWQGVLGFLMAALIVALVLAAVVHLIMGGIELRQTARGGTPGEAGDTASPFGRAQRPTPPQMPQIDLKLGGRAVAHLSALLAAIFVVVAAGQLFKGWSLLYSTAGAVYGAGYTDVHVRLPMTYVTMAVALALAAVLVWNVWRRHQWWPLAIAVWVVALIVVRGIVPAVYQSLIVNPNELSKERAYIARNIAATRTAFALDRIQQQPLNAKEPLTVAKLQANQPTMRNIRLWDPGTLVRSYRSLQELQPYYSFLDVDVDRYTVGGVLRQTMLSARELNVAGLPAKSQTWQNQHVIYTHGYGVAMSAVNQVANDGSPDFFVSDIPPANQNGFSEPITQPRIYYGERGTGYSLVKTKVREFDFPGPNNTDEYTTYQGSGGIPISPFLNRLAFAVHFGTINFFTTSAITGQSRIIIRNAIQERISDAAPFLALDHDPYMVIARGRLFWVQDAYTLTDRYPYSTPQNGVNYIRNSVKVVVDAYNGTMKFYVFDPTDPMIRTWQKIYPSLFTPRDQMPAELLQHLRYPEDMFTVQARSYATYHVDNVDVLYNKGDQWSIPENVSLSGAGPMDPYYVIMKLPGATKEEFLLMLPFVPNTRQNMISWLGARSDVPNYGKSVNFLFSKSSVVFGPAQVEAAINQDPDISAQRTLWGQEGSQVIMGNLLVVPVEDSLLYVQPLYLESTQTQLPQLKRVIVFYRAPAPVGGQGNAEQVVAMKPTLGEALVAAFGSSLSPGTTSGTGTGGATSGGTSGTTGGATGGGAAGGTTGGLSTQASALIARANQEFSAAQKALKKGDFAGYGEHIKALQQTLTALQHLQQ
ncbi:MAG TPA: UPF0182 family protein [Thermoleophilia bacterium]|nr:UPF0182 family protein [Thermoleophilia bacterium]